MRDVRWEEIAAVEVRTLGDIKIDGVAMEGHHLYKLYPPERFYIFAYLCILVCQNDCIRFTYTIRLVIHTHMHTFAHTHTHAHTHALIRIEYEREGDALTMLCKRYIGSQRADWLFQLIGVTVPFFICKRSTADRPPNLLALISRDDRWPTASLLCNCS